MKASLGKRVKRLENHGNLFNLDTPSTASEPEPERSSTRLLDGVFTGTVRDGDGLRVRIDRHVVLSRDVDGSWLIYSDDAEDDSSIRVHDEGACPVLDSISDYIADPEGVGNLSVPDPDRD
jgi:hypothetical protein